MNYLLYYWPGIPGRGEFVRLALEEGGCSYVDVAREDEAGGTSEMFRLMESEGNAHPAFAPPFLRAGRLVIGQTANILLYLGERHGLAPAGEAGRLWTHQLQLTLADFVVEIHDTHHPIGSGLYYEEQKNEAKRRAADFLANRLPKYLGYFEGVLVRNKGGGGYLAGRRLTYADLSLFHTVSGLRYAFPRAMAKIEPGHPNIVALHERVGARPRIAAFLASDRCTAFNDQGIFRHYPELDPPGKEG